MKNKISVSLVFILIFISGIIYSQELVAVYESDMGYNIIIIKERKNTAEEEINALEERIYRLLKDSNEECLRHLSLSPGQKEKTAKLQISYLKKAKSQGADLQISYREYIREFNRNPRSKETFQKKEQLKNSVNQIKETYNVYEDSLFRILDENQRCAYNRYIETKLKSMKKQWQKK